LQIRDMTRGHVTVLALLDASDSTRISETM